MILDNLIMNFDSNDGIKFATAFRYLSSLGPKDRSIQANLTLNQLRNSGKYYMRILDFSN